LPTKLCRFRQAFVVSDKRLSFPTKLCRFPTNALSENRELRNYITVMMEFRTRVRASTRQNDQKSVLQAHTYGDEVPGTVSTRTYTKDTFCPDLPISEGVSEHTNACGLPQLQKILPDLSYCFCTWKDGCLFISSEVAGCSFYVKGSKGADLSFGEFANGN